MDFTLNKVYDELRNALGAEFALIRNAPNELEKLKRLRMVISNVQQDACNQDLSQQNALSDWLDEMKDATYDAEDIIDTFNTEIHRRIINRRNNNHRIARFIYRVNDFFSCTTNPLIFRHKIGSSVQKTFGRLADIAKERKYHLPQSERNIRENTSWVETDAFTGRDNVMGRENDLENVIQLLFKEETDTDVLVLTGMGGIGKTMLAKLVYNDSRADAKFGKRKLWVCVSENFDLPQILRLIIEQIDGTPCQLEGKQALTKKLIDLLEGKMYFLVLDDVWANASLTDSWSDLKSLFPKCKILVTTRNANITSAMSHRFYIHNVGCLPEEVCRSLFENMAFPNGIVRAELKEIGEKIVTKCKGVPLAVRVLGSLLRDKQDAFWLEVEKDNFFDATNKKGEIDIYGILKFSYKNLSYESKFCFVYCSIFPKDSIMQKMDLCQQWTGNGFISSLNEANEIFMDLLSRCFFQDVEYDDLGNITTFYKMHDLIHDLAQSIAKRHCGILDNSNEDGFLLDRKNIRYLSIDMGVEASNISIQMKDAQKLRTLQSFSPRIMNHQFLVDCFSKLKFLRVLICSGAYIYEVPSSIDNLKLLRYVDFSYTYIKQLPETVCNLQNLQTLKVNNCKLLMALPKKLWKLSELRHLENVDLNLESMPVEMNKLSLLQTLSTFRVNDDGENLNELRYLNHLSGSIQLEKLDNTEGVSYENGILKEKKNLKSLVLVSSLGKYWDTSTGQVLEALEPHPSLKSLEIYKFGGSLFPTWMSDPSRCLVKVSLSRCWNCTRLPSFEHLQYLKDLRLDYLALVEGVDEVNGGSETKVFFPSLENLIISSMGKFTGWPESTKFPKLKTLKVEYCSKLKHMPHIPTTLCDLVLRICDNALLLKLFETHDLPSSLSTLKIRRISHLRHITDDYFENLMALRELYINDCEELVSFSNTAMKHLSSLQYLSIFICDNLESLPNMEHLSSLQRLVISHCQKLESLPDMKHLSSLQHLEIYCCQKLESLPDMKHLSSLQHLKISSCEKLGSLPDMKHLSSLQHLEITFCHNLESLPDIKHLSSLQHLKISTCDNLGSLPNMEHLSSLQHLRISYCQKLESLPNMKYLSSLQDLEIANCDNLGSLLINMGSLKHLSIDHCSKLNCVSINPDCLASLEKLEIMYCQNLVSLLPVGLKERMGDEVNGGSETKVFFPSLENLIIRNMGRFTGWPESTKFPKLKTLEINDCPKLKHMPHIPTTLCDLKLAGFDNALLLKLFETHHDLPSSLSTLEIGSISNLRHITDDYFENLTALRKLYIYDCEELVSFSNTAMKHLSSLQHLEIYSCDNLESLPNMKYLPSLQQLLISGYKKLESLPNMEHLSSLQHLKITFFHNLESLPDMKYLSSLQHLVILSCQKLESLPNMKHLSSLQDLEIDNCHNLGSLPNMKHLSSLQHLKISSCQKLGSLLINMGSLKHFGVYHCSKLNCVSIDPDCLASLKKLTIKYCRNLVSLLPVGLKERMGDALIIEGCPGLVS